MNSLLAMRSRLNRFLLVAVPLLVACPLGLAMAQSSRHGPDVGGALTATGASVSVTRRPGVDAEWFDNAEQALKKARQENKDLLLLFTGSDWCPPCQKLEEEVLGQADFLNEASKQFVLVVFDFPQQKELLPRVKEQNQQWAARFGINGYPTIILLDQQERPFSILGYQEGGVEPFLDLIGGKREKRIRRDELLAGAEELSGEKRAVQLDKALSEMDQAIADLYYEDLVKEIVDIDREDQLGLRTKWNAEADAEMRKIILTDIITVSRLEKPERAVEFVDEVLGAIKFTPSQRLQVYQIKLDLYRRMNDQPGMDGVLDQMIAMEELTEETRQRLMVKKALSLVGTGRGEQAMEMLDKALVQGQDQLYLWLAKGQLLDAEDRFDEAIAAFDQAISQARINPDVMIELVGSKADSLVAKGDPLSAIRILDNFADDQQMPSDLRGIALLHKALIMRETDRRRQARLAENRAIEVAESPEQRAEMQKLVERLRRKFGE
ncbi:MAG: thioredoxin family protein [Mariniblastus sp.]|nr:thioredoxin family protein [Mariniblastus sp.]